MDVNSKQVCKAAINLALSESRDEEMFLKDKYAKSSIKAVAIDFGGIFDNAVQKILERAVVASKREGLINESHFEEGAVAGAAHEALQQITSKSVGLNLGGKIGIARSADHISVCVFFEVGLLNLSDVAVGLGHRAMFMN